jgi:hypothetical protein
MTSTAVRSREDSVFPPDHDSKKRRQRTVKGKKLEKPFVFLPPDDLRSWVQSRETGGRTRTAVLVRCLEIARDSGDALDVDWWEVEKHASINQLSPGEVLGALARVAIRKGLIADAIASLKKPQK